MRKYFIAVTILPFFLFGCKPLVDVVNDNAEIQEKAMQQQDSVGQDSLGMPDGQLLKGTIVNGYKYYEDGVLTNGKTKVLFYHASWCPYCKEKDENLREWYQAEQIPLNTYRVDFDTEMSMRERFGVAQQDTFVVVDGSGKAITTLTSPSLGELKRVLYGNLDKAMENKAEEFMMKSEGTMENEPAMMMNSGGEFADFHPDVVGNGAPVVLFFHAKWCPYCIANEKRLNDWYSSQNIGTSTYKIDFDTSLELKKQFGVTQQDTFILLDADGQEVTRVTFPSETDLLGLLQ